MVMSATLFPAARSSDVCSSSLVSSSSGGGCSINSTSSSTSSSGLVFSCFYGFEVSPALLPFWSVMVTVP
jgi:hypothetical protein